MIFLLLFFTRNEVEYINFLECVLQVSPYDCVHGTLRSQTTFGDTFKGQYRHYNDAKVLKIIHVLVVVWKEYKNRYRHILITVKLGYNELGYNEKKFLSQMISLLHKSTRL